MFKKGNISSVQKESHVSAITINALNEKTLQDWEEIKSLLLKEFGAPAFKSWIAPITVKSLHNNILELSVSTRFVRDWVKTHYADRIRQIWTQKFNDLARVEITIDSTLSYKAENDALLEIPANDTAKPPIDVETISSPLDARFTFDNYVVAPSNELAYAAAKRLAENKDVTFNPLFLHSGVGLGKTHLMHAVAHEILKRDPERKVVYMSAEKFMYQFVRALRSKETMVFKEQLRSLDVLMIDDIQFICGKKSTQEEFFHTFNALIDENKQIVISANKPPSELDGMDERLISRLSGGLSANIQQTTYDLRLGILKKKCELVQRDVPLEVLTFLSETITSNVRELEGALNRVIAHAELVGQSITLEKVKIQLQDLLRVHERVTSIEEIQQTVASFYNIRMNEILSPRRSRVVARPRQIAMYLSKILTEHSLPEIGRKFAGRDHTTIMHGVRKIEELMSIDSIIKKDVETLQNKLQG